MRGASMVRFIQICPVNFEAGPGPVAVWRRTATTGPLSADGSDMAEDQEENQFRAARLEKLAALRQLGVDPPPEAGEIEQRYAARPAGTLTEDSVAVAGRVRAIRNSGLFIDLHDVSGKI